MLKRILPAFLIPVLTSCSLSPGIHFDDKQFDNKKGDKPTSELVSLVSITPQLVQKLHQQLPKAPRPETSLEKQNYDYLVGPQDVLSITVWEHPELTIPAGGQRPVEQEGNRVRSDGTIFYPYVGLVGVAGKSTEQIRQALTKKLSRYIKNPQLDVRVVGFNSQKVHVAGAIASPGVIPLTDVPLMLSDVITLAGGPATQADIQQVIVTRGGERRIYNLQALYDQADLTQNVLLKNHDIVYVPMNSIRKVYVLGEIGNSSAMPMPDGRLNLAEVIASAGINQNAADPERIFVLRRGAKGPMAYQLDATQPGALILATTFPLRPLDVVFVSTADITRWNRVLSQVMPTVQTLWSLDRLNSGR